MAGEGLVEQLLVALKVKREWKELKVEVVQRREKEEQMAEAELELHMMSGQQKGQYWSSHFEADLVG